MIEFRQTGLAYEGAPVLSDISCKLEPREFICVIGKNGCGKSTLLRAAAGLLPYSGSISLEGAEIREMPRQVCARLISYLPQARPTPEMSVQTLVAHGRYPHLGFSKTLTTSDRERIAEAAAVTGLEVLLRRRLSTLSGGERQRAYIAMMIAQDSRILLLDEPTAHLDIEHQLELMELLKGLHKRGKSVIMAVHDLPQSFSCATRILLLADGGIAAEGAPEELCQNPALEAALGVRVKKAEEANSVYSYRLIKKEVTGK